METLPCERDDCEPTTSSDRRVGPPRILCPACWEYAMKAVARSLTEPGKVILCCEKCSTIFRWEPVA